jgi:hypothetical protein
MRSAWIVAAIVAATVHVDARAEGVRRDDPRLVCESGKGFGYGHASAACWWAYDAALAKRDYEAALRAVATGCDKYARVDYCTFVGMLDVARARPLPVATAVQRYVLTRELERAELVVTPVDIADAEAAVMMREQAAAKRARKPAAAPAQRTSHRTATRVQAPG